MSLKNTLVKLLPGTNELMAPMLPPSAGISWCEVDPSLEPTHASCSTRTGVNSMDSGGLWHYRISSKTQLKCKSREIPFAHILFFSCPIVLQFCIEHGSATAVLCAKLQNNWATKKDVMDQWDFVRFGFEMNLEGISFIATAYRVDHVLIVLLAISSTCQGLVRNCIISDSRARTQCGMYSLKRNF